MLKPLTISEIIEDYQRLEHLLGMFETEPKPAPAGACMVCGGSKQLAWDLPCPKCRADHE